MSTLSAVEKNNNSSSTHLLAVITAVVVIAGLYLGKDLIIPFALALLLSFLLSAPVSWLERLHLGRPVAVVAVMALAFAMVGGLVWLGLQQLSGMAESFPQYRANIVHKMQGLRNPASSGIVASVENLNELLGELTSREVTVGVNEQTGAGKQTRTVKRQTKPLPVELVRTDTGLFSSFGSVSEFLIHYVELLAAVAILTLFMLLNRGHLRNRMFRLLGQGHLVLMTTAIDEAAERVSRYLLTQTLVNSCFGVLLGCGLWGLGVPYAPFWGALAACLRFVPYVGTALAGAGPLVLSLAVFDGWTKPIETVALFAVIEMTTSAAVEPWLYATRTGISSLAILISAAFWTLLWGPIGLILATPLTVCLAVLGRNIPHLAFLHVLLGDEPVLTPEICYYQRLLATDEEEAAELAEEFLKDKQLVELYDEMLIPALGLAERDRHNNRLENERAELLYRSTRDLLDEFAERSSSILTERSSSNDSILFVPVRDEADELVGIMAAQVLGEAGREARCLSLNAVGDFSRTLPAKSSPSLIVLSALPPDALMPARTLCRRLRRSHPGTKIILGLWSSAASAAKIKDRLGPQCSDAVVTTIAGLMQELEEYGNASGVGELAEAEDSSALVAKE